jgi:hypothetical protein
MTINTFDSEKDEAWPILCHGKVYLARRHYCQWRGKSDASKGKMLMYLYWQRFSCNRNVGITVREVSDFCGISRSYLEDRVKKWVEWEYLDKHTVDNNFGSPAFGYTIAKRGIHFLEDVVPSIVLLRWQNQIRQYRGFRMVKHEHN